MSSPRDKLEFDPATMKTLNDSSGKANSDIEMQTPGSTTRLFYDVKQVSSSESPPATPPPTRPPLVQKYSRTWWRVTWDALVVEGMWPRVFYSAVFFSLLMVWTGVMFGFANNENKYEKQNSAIISKSHIHHLADGTTVSKTGSFLLQGNLVNFDSGSRALTITWSGLYRRATGGDPVQMGNRSDDDTWWPGGIGIYRDVDSMVDQFPIPYLNGTVANATGPQAPSPGYQWMYHIDNATTSPIAVIGPHLWDSFDTEISFGQQDQSAWRQPLFGYPFDLWTGSMVLIANHQDWAKVDNVTNGDVVELAGAKLVDSALNWRFSLIYVNTCESPLTPDPYNRTTFNDSCRLELNLYGKRPLLVRFAAIVAVIVNWATTIFVFILTSESIIMRRAYMLEGTDLLSVCFTALFALPTVRTLLPGAPDFGAVNLVGIIPCVLILSCCTCVVAAAKLWRTEQREEARNERLKAEKAE